MAITELLKVASETARVEGEGTELEVGVDEVLRGEIVVVKPGERIPVNGLVLDGYATVNQAPDHRRIRPGRKDLERVGLRGFGV